MKNLRMISALISLSFCIYANAQTVKVAEDPESLRQMLLHQPDHAATVQSFYSENTSGTVKKSKIVILGNRRAEVTEDAIIIRERDKPTIKIFPKRKEYAEVPFQDNDNLFDTPQEVAGRNYLVFKSLGREKVGGYDCIKIEGSYDTENSNGLKYLFWAAPELKGLVVKTEIFYRKKLVKLLEDISLKVDEALFRVPAGYTKIVEAEL